MERIKDTVSKCSGHQARHKEKLLKGYWTVLSLLHQHALWPCMCMTMHIKINQEDLCLKETWSIQEEAADNTQHWERVYGTLGIET